MSEEQTFSAEDAVSAQRALRRELGLDDERFPVAAFVGMISDEIEQLRAAGRDDAAIAAIVTKATGTPLSSDVLERYYAPPEERRPPQ